MKTLLVHLSDAELLIAAGLASQSDGDVKYISFIAYHSELKRRGFSWKRARKHAAEFIAATNYPKRGWEKKYVNWI